MVKVLNYIFYLDIKKDNFNIIFFIVLSLGKRPHNPGRISNSLPLVSDGRSAPKDIGRFKSPVIPDIYF